MTLYLASSRMFSLTIAGKTTVAMMPYSDLFNHDTNENSFWRFNDTTNASEIYTEQDIEQGAPITLSYGRKSNSKLLSTYGFVVPGNPVIVAEFLLGIPDETTDPIEMMKKRVKRTGNPDTEFHTIWHTVYADKEGKDFIKMLRLARVSVATENVLDDDTVNYDKVVSIENEQRALQYILTEISRGLYQYSTTIEDDTKLLTGENASLLSSNARNIITVRLEEKTAMLELSTSLNKLLALAEAESLEQFNRLRYLPFGSGYVGYLETLAAAFRATFRSSSRDAVSAASAAAAVVHEEL
jgi:hypothetical protein